MKRCNSCKVNVDSHVSVCPLCFSSLVQKDNEPERVLYPAVSIRTKRWSFLRRVLFMISLAISVICLVINILIYDKLWWALIVIGNISYMWFAIHTMVRKHKRIGYNMLLQVLSLAVLLVVISFIIGWEALTLNYLLPLLFMAATISITVVTIVMRKEARNFVLYFFLIAVLGLVPIVLYAIGLSRVLYPSLVSAIYSGLSLVGLFVFAHRSTQQELTKRFHM